MPTNIDSLSIGVKENSNEIQKQFLDSFENEFIKRRNDDSSFYRKLSQEERKLTPIFSDGNKPPSFIDKIREVKDKTSRNIENSEKVWIVIDFDDVINKTTTYQRSLGEKVCSVLGLDQKEYEKMYEESKAKNAENKKVLRNDVLINKIKEKYPGQNDLVDSIFNDNINYNDFIDQGIKRALLALGGSSNGERDIRISILTFGDVKYQKGRIEQTDIDNVVDDIIYTEGSKREVIEALLSIEYEEKGIASPFLITIDDSKEQIEDYSDINLSSKFVNMHYRNPQGKKSMQESSAEQVVSVFENEQNEAAINLYKICKGCLDPDTNLSREKVFEMLNGKSISDFYQVRNEYNMGREKIIKKTDSNGVTRTIHFPANYQIGTGGEKKIIDGDNNNYDDYYSSVEAIYPIEETDIKYFQKPDGGVYRSSDIKFTKIENGIQKTDKKHKEKLVIQNNKLVYPFVNIEEFIKNVE